MSLDNLKITVLRAAKPGDVVFFNVGQQPDQETRDLVVALADYLRPTGIIPVMLPDNIRMTGSMFEPPAPTEPPALLTMAEVGQLIEWHRRLLAACAEERNGREHAKYHYDRITELREMEVSDGTAPVKSTPIPSPRTADSPDPEKTQSTGVRDIDPSAG